MALSVAALAALSAFTDQLADLDDAGLAVAAGVTEAEAAEFRASGGTAPEPEVPVEKPKKEAKAKAEKPPKAPEPEASVSEAPRAVIVVRNAAVTNLRGKPWLVSLASVFRGDKAAHLWAHHRDVVEAFDPKVHR